VRRFARILFFVVLAAAAFAGVAKALDFNDESEEAPPGEVGRVFYFELHSHAGCPPYHYVVESGQLPPGLTLGNKTPNMGLVQGIPTSGGDYKAWIALKDTCNESAELLFDFDIAQRSFFVATEEIPSARINASYTAKLEAGGHIYTSIAWSITKGSLPAGLTLAKDGTISGTPTAAGASTFTAHVEAVGDDSHTRIDEREYTLNVLQPLSVAATRRTAEVGVPFSSQLSAVGGTSTYTWSATGLPAGLAVDASGTIAGVPGAPGSYLAKVHFVDANGGAQDADVPLVVKPRLAIATARLASLRVGHASRRALAARGGVGPFRWTARGLPRGVHLSAAGVLAGKPSAAGTARVTVRVRDALGAGATKTYRLTVR
jgi:hypothetical protein